MFLTVETETETEPLLLMIAKIKGFEGIRAYPFQITRWAWKH